MDLDSDERNIAPNAIRYGLNILTNNSNASNSGCIENRKGNRLITFTLPVGENKVVGAEKDINKSAIVYLVYNSLKHHCILRYNIKTKTIDKICYDEPELNFQPDRLITSIDIVGDLFYWTDGYFNKFTYDPSTETKDSGFNPPRKINMLKAYNKANNIAVTDLYKYSAISEEVLDRIKYPPLNSPQPTYNTNSNKKINLLTGKLFQFAYRYVYDDNEISVLSPTSVLPLPMGSENPNDTYNIVYEKNNVIELSLLTGSEIVKYIQLFVRVGNTGDWYEFDTVNKFDFDGNKIIQDHVIYNYDVANGYGFYNDTQLIAHDQTDLARPFDFVGQIVDCQKLVSENRLTDVNIIENYDNVDIDLTLSWNHKELHFDTSILAFEQTYNPSGAFYKNFTDIPLLNNNLFIGYVYEILITYHYNNGTPDQTFLASVIMDSADITDPTNKLPLKWMNIFNGYNTGTIPYNILVFWDRQTQVNNSAPSQYDMFFNPGDDIANAPGFINWTIKINITADSTTHPTVANAFKEAHKKYFGVVYKDRGGRTGAVNKNKDTNIYIPTVGEWVTPNSVSGLGYYIDNYKVYNLVDWELNSIPPEWAVKYQFVMLKNTPNFQQFYYVSASYISGSNGKIGLDISDKISNLNSLVPNSVLKTYTFNNGDRLRFLYWGYNGATYYNVFTKFIDVPIIEFDETSGRVIIEDVGMSQYGLDCTGTNSQIIGNFICVEIYTPNKETESGEYIEFGEEFDIIDPHTVNRRHQGQTQDQTNLLPAKGTFYNGDIYVKKRYNADFFNLPVEAMNFSDIYESSSTSIGRTNVFIPDIQRKKYINGRYSDKYLEDTKVNGLSRFDFQNQIPISNTYGNVTALEQVGNTLKVLQESKNTSVDIGIEQLTGGGGDNINVVTSTKVFGNPRESTLNFGCVNPESVAVNDRHLYFWDQTNGCFLRDSANGMIDFSEVKYKCKSFFKRIKKECDEADSYKVITSFNKKYDQVNVSFITQNGVSNKVETIVFDENEEVWIGFLQYQTNNAMPIDYIKNIGETLVQFMRGNVYLDEDNVLFGNMFGEQQQMVVDVVANSEQEKEKVLLALGLVTNNNNIVAGSDANWYVESIKTPPTDVNVNGMATRIPATYFRIKEEALYADVPRDLNSPMSGTDFMKMANGRPMRGNSATIRLVNKSDKSVVLYSVIIKSLQSEQSK